ncbi:MAG: PspA/IM30 family protein [Acidobacteriota bacterium]
MNITQRLTLMIRGRTRQTLDRLEDPEATLEQLVAEMGSQLDAAKRAAAQAVANERRLKARLDQRRAEAERFDTSARSAVERSDDVLAREALRRAERARRQADELADQLATQEDDTRRVREHVARLSDRLGDAHGRLQLLRSRLRQTAARRAMGQVLRHTEQVDLYAEFDRLGERVELTAAEEVAYTEIGDDLSGASLRHRLETAELDDLVDARLDALKDDLTASA